MGFVFISFFQCFADGNPQNPANWTVLPSIVQGTDTFVRKEYVIVNGQQTTSTTTYTLDWVNQVWFRNGVSLGPGVHISEPFAKAINEADTLTASSQGSVRLRLQWNQAPAYPAPSQVRVRIHSTAYVLLGSNQIPAFTVDNGLNSPTESNIEPPWDTHGQFAPEIRTLKVHNGLAEFELAKSAFATRACQYGNNSSDVVWADAKGGYFEADSRNVLITALNGQVVKGRRVLSGSNAGPFPIPRKINLHHDNLQLAETIYFSYPNTISEPVEPVFDSSSANHAEWVISLPTWFGIPQLQFLPSIVHDHNATCYLLMHLTAIASGAAPAPGESYQWNVSPYGGSLPQNGSYVIPNAELGGRLGHHEFQLSWGGKKWLVWQPESNNEDEVSVTYTWADGVFALATRNIVYREPREEVATSQEVIGEDGPTSFVQFADWGLRVPSGIDSASALFSGSAFSTMSSSTLFGITCALLGAAAYWAPEFAIPAAIAALLAFSGEVVDPDVDPVPISRAHDTNWSFFVVGGTVLTANVGGEANHPIHHLPNTSDNSLLPSSFDPSDWAWEVKVRPRKFVTLKAIDQWGANGYVGRTTEAHEPLERMRNARRLYYFYFDAMPGGGGGGTNPGGG